MSVPKDLIWWPEAKDLLSARGYDTVELFDAFKAGAFPVYSPYFYDKPEYYGLFGFEKTPTDLWFEDWLWKQTRVERSFIDDTWPDRSLPEATVIPSIRGGGRPATYDWARLSAYMTAYLVEHAYPDTQADLERVVQSWFEKHSGKAPDESIIRRWVKTLCHSRDLLVAARKEPPKR